MISKELFEELYITKDMSINEVAKHTGFSYSTILRYKKLYGIDSKYFWTKEETEYLEKNYGRYPLEVLSNYLNKTELSIKGKAERMRISAMTNQEYINANNLAEALGVDNKTVVLWIKKRGLPGKKKTVYKTKEFWRIDINKFWKWAEKNQDVMNFSRFEKGSLGAEPKWVSHKREYDITNYMRKYKSYSKSEDDYLKLYFHRMMTIDIAKHLKRTEASVRIRAKKLGLKPKQIEISWKPIEVKMLIDLKLKGYTDNQIADELGRTYGSVSSKRKELIKNGILIWKYRSEASENC